MCCRLGWVLGAGLLTGMVLRLHRAGQGRVLAAPSLLGAGLEPLWVDTEAVDARVVTVLSPGPGLVTAGVWPMREGGSFVE